MNQRAALLSTVAVLTAIGCTRSNTGEDATDAGGSAIASKDSTPTLSRMRRLYVGPEIAGRRYSVIPPSIGATFERTSDGINVTGKRSVKLTLPSDATKAFVLESKGTRIAVRSLSAKPSVAQLNEHDAVVYPSAIAGGTWVHVPLEDGTEELLELTAPPKERALKYELSLEKVGGLRLVEHRVLEVLSATGDPMFHTSAPTIIDASGHSRQGTLAVEGCAVDESLALPWGRAVTPPGAPKCTVVARFDDEGLDYPILVDPAWTSAGNMSTSRVYHHAAYVTASTGTCSNGCVVVTGGSSGLLSSPLSSAEMYNLGTNTWGGIASMPDPHSNHVSAGYTDSTGAGRVLVAGGSNGSSETANTALYTINGTWAASTSLSVARTSPMIAQADNSTTGYIYILGGTNQANTNFFRTVDRFGNTHAASPAWATAANMNLPAPAIGNGVAFGAAGASTTSIAVGGGMTQNGAGGTNYNANVWYMDNALQSSTVGLAWVSAGTLSVARSHMGVALTPTFGGTTTMDMGGGGSSIAGAGTAVDRYSFGAHSVSALTAKLSVARQGVLGVSVGQFNFQSAFVGGNSTDVADLLNGAGSAVGSTTLASGEGRSNGQATRLPGGNALFTGGGSGFNTLSTAEFYNPQANGQPCQGGADCVNLNCIDGYCCDTACTGQCQACNLPSALGTCTTVTKTNGPAGYPAGQAVTGYGGTSRTGCTNYGTPCGSNCDGTSPTACNKTPDGTTCSAPSCASGVETKAATCLSSACQTAATAPCEPYACGATACKTTCAANGDCAPGYKCSGTICVSAGTAGAACSVGTDCMTGLSCVNNTCCTSSSCGTGERCDVVGAKGTCKLPYGAACTSATASQCALGFCQDGVCCDAGCTGQCEACNVAGSVGKCVAVAGQPHGTRTQCTGTGSCQATCDGSDRSKCSAPPGPSTVCAAATCTGGTHTPTRFCDGTGVCTAVSSSSCGAYVCDVGGTCKVGCTTNTDCASGYFCSGGLCKTSGALGSLCFGNSECLSGHCVDGACCSVASCTAPQTCNANGKGTCSQPIASACTSDSQCGSGHCADGVCCNATCSGQCEACDVAGSIGSCIAVPGKPHGSRAPCAGTGACQASCDGANRVACGTPPGTSTTCATPSCAAGIATPPSYCDGAGNCKSSTTKACSPYICDATDCKATCTADADCASGYRCFENACVPKAGVPCTSAADCASGYCTDGVCCDGACTGQCEACDVPGSEGKCSAITGKPHGSTRGACYDGGGDVCKALACDGSKDRTKCVGFANAFETTCGMPTCTTDGFSVLEAPRCDGAGACKPSTTSNTCGLYACADGACKTKCTTAADCAPKNDCEDGVCKAQSAKCTPDGTGSQPAGGLPVVPCQAYKCDPSNGGCYATCTSSDQCADGFVCGSGACVAQAPSGDTGSSGGCSTSAASSTRTSGATGLVTLLLVGLAARRRRAA